MKFPSELCSIHPVFHVSILKKCISDPECIKGLGVQKNLSYEKVPIEILIHQVKRLRNKELASVKVLWRNHLVKRATWEAEADMKSRHTHLFHNEG